MSHSTAKKHGHVVERAAELSRMPKLSRLCKQRVCVAIKPYSDTTFLWFSRKTENTGFKYDVL